jgi:GT2 family glycosyltransferase
VSTTDAINAYRLFLGRQPETERVVSEKADLPIRKLVSNFLGAREFSERVLSALTKDYPLPHYRSGAFPDREMLEWVHQSFALPPATLERTASDITWRKLLKAVLKDPAVRRAAPPAMSGVLAELENARSKSLGSLEQRELAGSIDDFSTFEIRGWAADLMNPDEPLKLEVFLDNLFVGVAETGFYRREIQEKIGGEGKVGFAFNIPAAHQGVLEQERLLTVREALSRKPIAIPTRVKGGQASAFDALVHLRREIELVATNLERIKALLPNLARDSEYPLAMYDSYQRASRTALKANRHHQESEAAAFSFTPKFSIILSGVADRADLISSIGSLRRQTYQAWECIPCIAVANDEGQTTLDTIASADGRIKSAVVSSDAESWKYANHAIQQATGDYVVWLTAGDLLSDDALFELARLLQDQNATLIYFDEDRFERYGGTARYTFPVLKGDFDHELLLASNYVGNAFACQRESFNGLGGLRGEFGDASEYDFLLRATERLAPAEIVHLQKILYHRRSVVRSHVEDDTEARVACVNAHLQRIGADAIAEPHSDPFGAAQPECQRIVWRLPGPVPKISIIIPTRDRADLLRPCVESVLQSQDAYPETLEIMVVDNESAEAETHALFQHLTRDRGVRLLPSPGSFNWSAINNAAAREATGDILLFLNNDTRVLSPDWVRELASMASRHNVGAVGGRLLYEDGTIQHAGVVLGGRAIHEAAGQRPDEGGYFGRTALQRNVSAVTGACLATRKSVFIELGGFDDLNLKVAFNDVDYCLKARAAGLSVIYTPFATLYHLESKSRGLDDNFSKRLRSQNEIQFMRARWGNALENDPFYNVRFNRTGTPFSRLRPPQLMALATEDRDDEQELWGAE